MFIFHTLIVWYQAWIGNLLIGGLNVHSVLYTNWTFNELSVLLVEIWWELVLHIMPFKKREEKRLTFWWPAIKSCSYCFLTNYKFKIRQWNQRDRVTCKHAHPDSLVCSVVNKLLFKL